MKRSIAGLALFLAAFAANSDTVYGRYTDSTPAGPEYAPVYSAQCNVDGALQYDVNDLATPELTISAPTAVPVECRMMATNNVVPAYPIAGSWTPWAATVTAATPAELGTAVLIRIVP